MNKNRDSESGLLNTQLLLAFSLCSIGVLLGIFSFAQVPTICVNCGSNPVAFLVRSYQGTHRCLDYSPEQVGSPIFINECSASHAIVVEDLNDGKHTVVLHAGSKVIGAQMNNGPTHISENSPGSAPASTTESPLTLQNPPTGVIRETIIGRQIMANQHFTLDGDSIMLTASMGPGHAPAFVAKVQNARGKVGSPVVVGPRNLADNEFWDFVATDHVDRDPTSGFVRVGYPGDIYCYDGEFFDNNACVQRLYDVVTGNADRQIPTPGPGTVIKIGTSLDLTGFYQLNITSSGLTIRGDRRGTSFGPELRACWVIDGEEKCDTVQTNVPEITMIVIGQGVNDVRLTGLRLHGPSRDRDSDQQRAYGVITFEDNFRNLIDHNDFSDWTETGVQIQGDDDGSNNSQSPSAWEITSDVRAMDCQGTGSDPQRRPTTAFIAHNFIHHNEKQNSGYGVESHLGAYPFIMGNTFVSNRHCIAAGFGSVHTGYRAWYNLVLSSSALQVSHDVPYHTQDFDMHGTASSPVTHDQGFGGLGGDYTDIYRNTFLGTNRPNFELRGIPCNYAQFHDNISLEGADDAVQFKLDDIAAAVAVVGGDALLRVSKNPNQFTKANPMYQRLGVGDFDGDGADDLFVATGAAWYYSPGGKAEWRLLSAKTDTTDQLLFGDFDGDGRTDVVAIHGGQFVVSWGGVSDWEVLNPNPTDGRLFLLPSAATNMAVGDFIGDSRSDIFFADGTNWYLSDGGSAPFVMSATSSFRVKDLRFGDFDGDGKTDVFGVVSGTWSYSKSAQGTWSDGFLRPALSNSVNGLVVADFNGDGFADVAANCDDPGCWRISYGGFQDWYYVSQVYGIVGPHVAGYGHFTGYAFADFLAWNLNVGDINNPTGACGDNGINTQLCISVAGFNPLQHYSTQDMR